MKPSVLSYARPSCQLCINAEDLYHHVTALAINGHTKL